MIAKEIHSFSNDKLNLSKYVEGFINNYIIDDFTGTVLLNGKWGIGKSSYLNLIKKETTNKNANIKFIDINFWTDHWEDKPFELIAKKLNKTLYFTIKFFPIIFVMVLAGLRFMLDFFTSNTNEISTRDLAIWIILILSIALMSFFIKYLSLEDIYLWYLKHYKNNKLVFVCDDFDRIDEDKRLKLYSLISKINDIDSFTFIALGDYERLINNNDDSLMLQKILTNIENMPSEYTSKHVWEIFEEELQSKIKADDITREDKQLFTDMRNIFINEERTFRDASQLLELLKRSYTEERKEVVNSSEFLSICYLYQFYNPLYKWIFQNNTFVYELSSSKEKSTIFNDSEKEEELSQKELLNKKLEKLDLFVTEILADFIVSIFSQSKGKLKYPSVNKEKYLKNYKIENLNLYISLTSKDVERIFINNSSSVVELEKLLEKDQFEDFYELFKVHYLGGSTNKEYKSNYEDLLGSLSILLSKHNLKGSGLFSLHPVESLFYNVKQILINEFDYHKEELFKNNIKCNKEMDLSQKLSILPKFVAAKNEEEKVQLKLVEELFEEHTSFDILKQIKPNICFYFYTAYYSSLDKRYTAKFEPVLKLQNEELEDFLLKHFVSTVRSTSGDYDVLYLDKYMFNEKFKNEFNEKIGSFPKKSKEKINRLIKNAQDSNF